MFSSSFFYPVKADTERKIERERERDTHTHTHRKKERKKERQRERLTQRERETDRGRGGREGGGAWRRGGHRLVSKVTKSCKGQHCPGQPKLEWPPFVKYKPRPLPPSSPMLLLHPYWSSAK